MARSRRPLLEPLGRPGRGAPMTVRSSPIVQAALARFPGAGVVDVRQAPADEGGAAPADNGGGPRFYRLSELQQTAIDEALRIEASQDALVAVGDRVTPHGGELARRDRFNAIARLIARVM